MHKPPLSSAAKAYQRPRAAPSWQRRDRAFRVINCTHIQPGWMNERISDTRWRGLEPSVTQENAEQAAMIPKRPASLAWPVIHGRSRRSGGRLARPRALHRQRVQPASQPASEFSLAWSWRWLWAPAQAGESAMSTALQRPPRIEEMWLPEFLQVSRCSKTVCASSPKTSLLMYIFDETPRKASLASFRPAWRGRMVDFCLRDGWTMKRSSSNSTRGPREQQMSGLNTRS